jgi:hypothetical protein
MNEANQAALTEQEKIDDVMAKIRQQAIALTAKIDPVLLDQIHAVIKGCPAAVASATVAGVLADIMCHISKTEDGLGKNVLIVSEMILKVATSGLKNKEATPAASKSIIH